jgi:fumarate hydratase class II
MGKIDVPANRYYGAQTARSLIHFAIGQDTMPCELIRASASSKSRRPGESGLGNSPPKKPHSSRKPPTKSSPANSMTLPSPIWQTGSGTQTNMNVNEVIGNRAIEIAGGVMGSKKPFIPR